MTYSYNLLVQSTSTIIRFAIIIYTIVIICAFLFLSNTPYLENGDGSQRVESNFEIVKRHSSLNPNAVPKAKFHQKRSLHNGLTKEDVESGKLRIAQDNWKLLNYIRRNNLIRPPSGTRSLPVDATPFDPSVGINLHVQQEVYRFIIKLLNHKKQGFYIECGANDGEFFSNTLPFELKHNWTGLLIEADSRPFKRLLRRNRNAWASNACLSTTNYPIKIEMLRNKKLEGLSFVPGLRHFIGDEKDYYKFQAQCFPLYSILKAINVTVVDYFSLDIEGAELSVLKTIPWNKVYIRSLSIEVHLKFVSSVRIYMTSVGYKYVTFIKNEYSHDQIYIHSLEM